MEEEVTETTPSAQPCRGEPRPVCGFRVSMVPGLLGLSLGLAYCFFVSSYSVGTPAAPGPGVFPLFVGSVLVLSSVSNLIGEWLRPSPAPEAVGGGFRRVAAVVLALLAFTLALTDLGFVIAAAGMCAAIIMVAGRRRWWVATGIATVASMLVYQLFQLLGVSLPAGMLPF